MGALMHENERRLTEITRLTEDRLRTAVAKKADRDALEAMRGQMLTKEDLVEGLRKLKEMQRALDPLYGDEVLLNRLIQRLQIMQAYSDEEIKIFEDNQEGRSQEVSGDARSREDAMLRQIVIEMRAQISKIGNKVQSLCNDEIFSE